MLLKLAENMKIQVWECNDKCYLNVSDKTIQQYVIDQSNETQHGDQDINCLKVVSSIKTNIYL